MSPKVSDGAAASPREARELILILGGARSGKSAFAQRLANRRWNRVTFLATGKAVDEEMRSRIREHQKRRPSHWKTVEAGVAIGAVIRGLEGSTEAVLLDCLGALVSNVMMGGLESEGRWPPAADSALEAQVQREIEGLIQAFREGPLSLIIVSNEVGMGVVPAHRMGRTFRDLLGRANQRLAQEADEVYLVIAGIPVDVKLLQKQGCERGTARRHASNDED